jgi:hypothetical protein
MGAELSTYVMAALVDALSPNYRLLSDALRLQLRCAHSAAKRGRSA